MVMKKIIWSEIEHNLYDPFLFIDFFKTLYFFKAL